MPRLQLFSDLHADVSAFTAPVLGEGVDAVVVAGDTMQGALGGFELLRQLVPKPTPLVVVCGNHEFYRRCVPEVLAAARGHAYALGVTLLEDAAAAVAGVRFLGCTLWTDSRSTARTGARAMETAARSLNDHRRSTWQKSPAWLRFRPLEAWAAHRASRRFLEEELASPWNGPTVVVTHHAPHPRSVPSRFEGDPLNAAYASDLSALIGDAGPDL